MQLLCGVTHSVFAYKTQWINKAVGPATLLTMSLGIPEMVQKNCNVIKSGNYCKNFIYHLSLI